MHDRNGTVDSYNNATDTNKLSTCQHERPRAEQMAHIRPHSSPEREPTAAARQLICRIVLRLESAYLHAAPAYKCDFIDGFGRASRWSVEAYSTSSVVFMSNLLVYLFIYIPPTVG